MMNQFVNFCLLCTVCLCGQASSFADVVLDIRVDILQAGPVSVGSTVNWNVFASSSLSDGTNYGLTSLDIDLTESHNEVLSAGLIGAPFSDYDDDGGFLSGGTPISPGLLRSITAFLFVQDDTVAELIDPSNGGSLAEVLVASGSYTVNTIGTHTLTPSSNTGLFQHFTASGQGTIGAVPYTSVNFMGDSVTVVPEPSSLAFATMVFGLFIGEELKRRWTI